jgi:integrase
MSIPKTLTADQCQSFIEELMPYTGTDKQQMKATRNSSIAIVLLETGIRVGELCGLRVEDLWFSGMPVDNLIVRKEIAKNKKERQIPISRKLAEVIKLLESTLWTSGAALPGDFAFFARTPAKPLTTRTIERFILAAGKSAFNLEVTPHMLRHTFGSRMMRKTNARVVQALLGHASLSSTQIYMHPNSEDLKNAINGL